MSWSSYLGPFFAVRKPRKQITVDLCQDHTFGPGNYCSECGRHKDSRYRKKEDRPKYPEHLWERLPVCSTADGSPLDTEDYYVDGLRPNCVGIGWYTYDIHEGGGTNINVEDIYDATEWFENHYSKEKAELQEKFGSENVSLEYGFLSWYT